MSIGLHNLTIWFDKQWVEEVGAFIQSQKLPVDQPGLICGFPNHTMLSYACQKKYFTLIKMLFEQFEADVNTPDSDGLGWNGLLWACHLGHLEIVQYLCETCGATLSYRDSTAGGRTAIEVAQLAGHDSIVSFLVTFAQTDESQCSIEPENRRRVPGLKNISEKAYEAKIRECIKDVEKFRQRTEDIRSMYHQVVAQRDLYEQENIGMHQTIELLQLENESLRALRAKERSREALFSSPDSVTEKDLEEITKLQNDLQSENSRLKQEIDVLHTKLENEDKIRLEYEKQLRETQEQVLQLRSNEKPKEKEQDEKSPENETQEQEQQSRRPFFAPSRKEIARKVQTLSIVNSGQESVSNSGQESVSSGYKLASTRSLSGSDSLEKYDIALESHANSSITGLDSEDSTEETSDQQNDKTSRHLDGSEGHNEIHWDCKSEDSEEEHEVSVEDSVGSTEESVDESLDDHEAAETQEPFGKRLLSLFGKRDEAPDESTVPVQAKPWFWQKHQQLPSEDW